MSFTLTDFNFGDLMVLISMVNIVINFLTILLYEEIKSLKNMEKEKKC